MREKELSDNDLANMSDSELRELKRQEKRARRERRRNSVLISLQAQEEEHAVTLPRASSTPDIRPLRMKSKRVSFTLEPLTLPMRLGDAVKPLPPINRPILVKKRKVSCLPPSEVPHVDYETFAAWRRGSRLSLDVTMAEQIRAHHKEVKERLAAERASRSLVANLAYSLKQCFVRRSARTSPVDWKPSHVDQPRASPVNWKQEKTCLPSCLAPLSR